MQDARNWLKEMESRSQCKVNSRHKQYSQLQSKVSKMTQWVDKVYASKPDNLTHMVEEQNQLLQGILGPSHVYQAQRHTQKHTHNKSKHK